MQKAGQGRVGPDADRPWIDSTLKRTSWGRKTWPSGRVDGSDGETALRSLRGGISLPDPNSPTVASLAVSGLFRSSLSILNETIEN